MTDSLADLTQATHPLSCFFNPKKIKRCTQLHVACHCHHPTQCPQSSLGGLLPTVCTSLTTSSVRVLSYSAMHWLGHTGRHPSCHPDPDPLTPGQLLNPCPADALRASDAGQIKSNQPGQSTAPCPHHQQACHRGPAKPTQAPHATAWDFAAQPCPARTQPHTLQPGEVPHQLSQADRRPRTPAPGGARSTPCPTDRSPAPQSRGRLWLCCAQPITFWSLARCRLPGGGPLRRTWPGSRRAGTRPPGPPPQSAWPTGTACRPHTWGPAGLPT